MNEKRARLIREYEEKKMALSSVDFIKAMKAEAKSERIHVDVYMRGLRNPHIGLSAKMHRKIDDALQHMRKVVYIDEFEEIEKLRKKVSRLQKERVRSNRKIVPQISDERPCCGDKLKVMPDGSVKKDGKLCKFTAQQGKVLYAFASHNGAGYVTYSHLHKALWGVHTAPSARTQGSIRTALSRTKQVLDRYVKGWDFVAHDKLGWTLE